MINFLSQHFYEINRNRQYLQDKIDKRKTFILVCGITICVTISVIIWITYA